MVGIGNIVSVGGAGGSGGGSGSSSGIQNLNGQTGPVVTIVGTSGVVVSPVAPNIINIGATSITSLQDAYDNGREVTVDHANDVFIPALFKMDIPGGKCVEPLDQLYETSSAIAVSGFTLTPENPDSFSFLRVGANGIVIRGSGLPGSPAATVFFGYDGCRSATKDPDNALITTSGFLTFEVSRRFRTNVTENIDLNSTTGNILLRASTSVASDEGGQIRLSAFEGSGQLRYNFGPYEAWHVSPSHTSDYFPIAHSGQVTQMIAEATTSATKFAASFSNITSGVFTHGLGTLDVVVQIYDDQVPRRVILPDEIVIDNVNQASVLFNRPQSGRIIII